MQCSPGANEFNSAVFSAKGRQPSEWCQRRSVTQRDNCGQYYADPGIAVDGLKKAEKTNTLRGMYGIEILCEIEYQHREGERCSQAYLN